MENFLKKIKELPASDFPGGLHNRIISRMVVLKFRTYLIVVTGFLVLNFLALSWHILTRIIDAEAYAIFSTLLQDFELSYSFISDFTEVVFEIIPINLIVAFIINLALIIYFIYFRFSIKNSLKENLI